MRPVCIFLHRRSLVQLLTKAQQISIGTLVGKTRMLILPDYTPWQDGLPHFSPKTFVQACLKFLEEGNPQSSLTHIYFGYMSRYCPPRPEHCPIDGQACRLLEVDGTGQRDPCFPPSQGFYWDAGVEPYPQRGQMLNETGKHH